MPPFFHDFFQLAEIGGELYGSPQKNGTAAQTGTNRHKPTQTGTNRHKPAQTGTNRHKPAQFMCRGRGEAHLPPFHCLLLQPAASVHLHGGARDCHPVGDARSVGHLVTGGCRGAYTVASVVPSSSGSYSLSPLSLKPHFCAVAAVAFGRCPAPSCHHCYHLVDCRFVRVADATSSASYSSPSSLRPHFVAVAAVAFGHCPAPSHHHCYRLVDCWMPIPHHQRHIRRRCCWGPIFVPIPSPPPADRRLRAARRFPRRQPFLRGYSTGETTLGGGAHRPRRWPCRDGRR